MAKAMPTTMTPTKGSQAKTIGPMVWAPKVSTTQAIAVSKRASKSGWTIGSGGARDCNKGMKKRIKPFERQKGASGKGRYQRLLAGPAEGLGGPKTPPPPAFWLRLGSSPAQSNG